MKKINIVVAGLRFGGSFLPIYLDHPNVAQVGIYDPNVEILESLKNNMNG